MNYPIYEKPYELWFALHDDLPYMKGGLRTYGYKYYNLWIALFMKYMKFGLM